MPIFKIRLCLALFFSTNIYPRWGNHLNSYLKYNTFKIEIINEWLRVFDQIKMHSRLDGLIKRRNF